MTNNDPIIEEFNKTIDSYNEEYAKATSPEEQDKISEKFESKISEAEKVMETAYEKQFKEEEEALKKEQEESEIKEESSMKNDYLSLSTEELVKKYKVKEHRVFAKENWITIKGNESEMIEQIKKSLSDNK